jgi:Protein of unknown function (DUF3306)
MSDPKDFLARWSQRKLSPEAQKPAPEEKTASLPSADEKVPSTPDHEFDITSLPPLESIGANSDIRAFLQRGVPMSLSRAALRRAWSADPAIRDFIGLSENSWDFNAPESIPGFGSLDADEVRRIAAQFFGEVSDEKTSQAPEPELQGSESNQDSVVTKPSSAEADDTPAASSAPDSQRSMDVATQQEKLDEPNDLLPRPRRHGGALPE